VAGLEPTVALDPLGDGFTVACLTALQPFGRLALYGVSAGDRAEVDLRMLYRKSIQLHTFSSTIQSDEQNHRALIEAVAAAARGEFRVVVADVMPLEQAAEAHRRIKYRQVQGKLLLEP
jgi:NADPH:quinone reductase